MKRPIYLDHHATTPLDPRVLDAMLPYLREDFGNPASSTHLYGWRAEAALTDARERLAAAIGAGDPAEIVFTSGTTESDNLALLGVVRASRQRRRHLVTSVVEHPAVLDACRALEGEGVEVSRLPVDAEGRLDPSAVEAAIGPHTRLVSVGAANGEVGTVQPLDAIGAVCRERGVPFHSDGAQWVGKLPVSVREVGIDLLAFCAHKIYGPKGIGALYVRGGRPRIPLQPILHGGGHQAGRRSGTLPVAQCVGFALALELCVEEKDVEARRQCELRDRLLASLEDALPGVWRNGAREGGLPGNLNVSFDGVAADALLPALPELALSTGSACASANAEPSHVLIALGLAEERVRGALRIGLGRGTGVEDVDFAAQRLIEEVRRARGASSRAKLGGSR